MLLQLAVCSCTRQKGRGGGYHTPSPAPEPSPPGGGVTTAAGCPSRRDPHNVEPSPLCIAQDQPSSYKTKVCRSFSRSGRCPYGARCRFVHGDVAEAQQLAMMRLMGESPLLPSQLPQAESPSPLMTSSCPPGQPGAATAQPAGHFAQLQLPTSGALDLSMQGVLLPSAQLPQQPLVSKPHSLEDQRTSYASSYASSAFSSYASPQLVPTLIGSQPLPTRQTSQLPTPQRTPPHTPQQTPLLAGAAPAWPELSALALPPAAAPSVALSPPSVTPPTHLSPIERPTGGSLPAPFALPAAFSLPPPQPAAANLAPSSAFPPRRLDDFKLESELRPTDQALTLLDDRRKGVCQHVESGPDGRRPLLPMAPRPGLPFAEYVVPCPNRRPFRRASAGASSLATSSACSTRRASPSSSPRCACHRSQSCQLAPDHSS